MLIPDIVIHKKEASLSLILSAVACCGVNVNHASQKQAKPLVYEDVIIPAHTLYVSADADTFCTVRLSLAEDFNGRLAIDRSAANSEKHRVIAVTPDTVMDLHPMIGMEERTCEFVSDRPIRIGDGIHVNIPAGLLKIKPQMEEVDEIDIDQQQLVSLAVAGAWHKAGGKWNGPGMFSVIDDDSLDGQIPSSKHSIYTFGYWSLLYPMLESLDIKGNLAVEGRKIGIDCNPPYLNDNGRTLMRLQDEKGWNLLSHSMECLGEIDNNWLVDSVNSPLASLILQDAPNTGQNTRTVSVYDKETQKQYWPNTEYSEWEETPKRFIKPYVGDYAKRRNVMYNPDFDVDWHWGETKSRAERFGLNYVGFVTHNSTSSHALVNEICKVFPYGLSDIGDVNINYPPLLSSAVRSGLEGQSLGDYDGESKDNTFNKKHFKKFCAQVDEAVKKGGWIIFNLHAYRDVWNNRLPGALVSEGGSYPDEWVIPMKGLDSSKDPLTPPSHLGINDWSEWYPCPGTRLEMIWEVFRYAKEKGLKPVTCAEGFAVMGNKAAAGYFNNGHKFGMDRQGLIDTEDIYPHYIVSAIDEVSYYNPLWSEEHTVCIDELRNLDAIQAEYDGEFLISRDRIVWSCANPYSVVLRVYDLTGKTVGNSSSNSLILDESLKGMYLVCALHSGAVIGSIKIGR